MRLLFRWLLNAGGLMLIAYYVPGISVTSFYTALMAALVLGLINALLRPLILLLTLPVNVITLGFFTLVVNAVLFWLTATIVKGFNVTGFWPAFLGALLMCIISWVVSGLLKNP